MHRAVHASCPPRVSNRPLKLGVLGNSIAVGVGIPNANEHSWPAQLAKMMGHGYEVINRGVRASRADLATLCCDELFNRTWPDLAIVDYTFTSDTTQIIALVDRVRSFGVHAAATLYCHPPRWLNYMRCGGENCTSPSPRDGAQIREDFGSSIDERGWPIDGQGRVVQGMEARAEFARLGQLPAGIMQRTRVLFWWGAHATSNESVFDGAEAVQVAAAAAWDECILSLRTDSPSCARSKPIVDRLRDAVGNRTRRQSSAWRYAASAVAAGHCLHTYHSRRMIAGLESRNVPYTSNAAGLSRDKGELLGWARHPSLLGHTLIAEPVARLLRRWCPTDPVPQRSPSHDTVCLFGSKVAALMQSSDGFERVDIGGGRTGGVAAARAGAELVECGAKPLCAGTALDHRAHP